MLKEHDGMDVRDPTIRERLTKRMLEKHSAGPLVRLAETVDQTIMELGAAATVSDVEYVPLHITSWFD